jgi:hypothetical protein
MHRELDWELGWSGICSFSPRSMRAASKILFRGAGLSRFDGRNITWVYEGPCCLRRLTARLLS